MSLGPGGGHLLAAASPTASVERRSKLMPTSQTCCHIGTTLQQCGGKVSTDVTDELLMAAHLQRR